ncbi:MAG: hypothetical protein AB1743_05460 [Actinomycetota bacterium]
MEKAKGGKTLIESILRLIDLASLYIRQQLKNIVEQGISVPIKSAGRTAAFFILAFSLFSLASIFIAIGLFLLLASFVGHIIAYLVVGALLAIAGAIVLAIIKHR